MIVFQWEKWDTHSTIYLKEYKWNSKVKFWKWKSTLICHSFLNFEIKDIFINKDTKRYVIVTSGGIYESDGIETTYYKRGIECITNSTWNRKGGKNGL